MSRDGVLDYIAGGGDSSCQCSVMRKGIEQQKEYFGVMVLGSREQGRAWGEMDGGVGRGWPCRTITPLRIWDFA